MSTHIRPLSPERINCLFYLYWQSLEEFGLRFVVGTGFQVQLRRSEGTINESWIKERQRKERLNLVLLTDLVITLIVNVVSTVKWKYKHFPWNVYAKIKSKTFVIHKALYRVWRAPAFSIKLDRFYVKTENILFVCSQWQKYLVITWVVVVLVLDTSLICSVAWKVSISQQSL